MPGTLAGATTVTVNVSPTLSGITYNSPFSHTLATGTGASIIAATGGLTLNAQLTPANTPTLFQLANTISSPISGGGTADLTKTGVGTVNLSGANNNATTNLTNRVNDNAPVTVRGVNFVSTGNTSAAFSETIGAVTGASSLSTFLVTPGTGQSNSLTMASLTRTNNATFGFVGAGVGGTPGAGVANIFATAAPALTGGGGAAGTTTQSILLHAFGNSAAAPALGPSAFGGMQFARRRRS